MEIRSEALEMCKFFSGACNDSEDMFDVAVYRNNGLLLYGSQKPGRTSYVITRAYTIRKEFKNESEKDIDLVKSSLRSLPPPIEILKQTILRTDEDDVRFAKNKIPIKIPINKDKLSCNPN